MFQPLFSVANSGSDKMPPPRTRERISNGSSATVQAPTRASEQLRAPKARSRVTNGKSLLPRDVDARTSWVRRLKDLIALHTADLGDAATISEAERAIVRRACTLIVILEQQEMRFAQSDEDATPAQIDSYQRAASTMRRLLESVGLHRRQRDVTPSLDAYLLRGPALFDGELDAS